MIVKNMVDLEKVIHQKKINEQLYQYVKGIVEKSNEMLQPSQMKIIIKERISVEEGYTLKWSRKIKISGEEYMESLYVKDKNGILIINSVEEE